MGLTSKPSNTPLGRVASAIAMGLVVVGCVDRAVREDISVVPPQTSAGSSTGAVDATTSRGGGVTGAGPNRPVDGSDGPGGDDGLFVCDTERMWVEAFLTANCGQCHGPDADPVEGGFNWVNDVGLLLGTGRIVAGSAEDSELYRRIAAGEMPPDEPLVAEDIGRVGSFIDACDDEGPGIVEPPRVCTEVQPLDIEAQIELMALDLSDEVAPADRPFTRYLTCAHLAAQGYCAEEIATYTDAVVKVMNSTMVDGGAQPVDAIEGSGGAILRIDLQDFAWDLPVAADVLVDGVVQNLAFDDKWDLVSTASPFGYVPDLRDGNAQALVERAEEIIPFLLCDAFVEITTRADVATNSKGLYHELAGVPSRLVSEGNGDSLEERLGFDIQVDVDQRDVLRAGVSESLITRSDVLAQRHGGRRAFVWIRYDADGDEAQLEDVLSNPVDFDQVFDVAAVLYRQPNGFPAYMAVDAEGLRVDFLPAEVFPDPALTDLKGADNQVFLSCTGCHGGSPIRPLVDEVRDLYEADDTPNDGVAPSDVAALYPRVGDVLDQIAEDNEQVLEVYAEVMSRIDVDPVRVSFIAFRGDLLLSVAASELGFADDRQLDVTELGEPFAPLGDGGTVSRDAFETEFERLVCEVGAADEAFCARTIGQLDQTQLDLDFSAELALARGVEG